MHTDQRKFKTRIILFRRFLATCCSSLIGGAPKLAPLDFGIPPRENTPSCLAVAANGRRWMRTLRYFRNARVWQINANLYRLGVPMSCR
jgi:hypothetical protein